MGYPVTVPLDGRFVSTPEQPRASGASRCVCPTGEGRSPTWMVDKDCSGPGEAGAELAHDQQRYGRAEQAAQNRHCQPDRGQAGMKGGSDDRRRRRTACDMEDTAASRVAERVSG